MAGTGGANTVTVAVTNNQAATNSITNNQSVLIIISSLIDSDNDPQIIELFENTLDSYHVYIFVNIFNASFFGLVGIILLIAKIIQFVNNERPNALTEAFIFSSLTALLLWIPIFFIIIGFDPPPSVPIPDIGLNFTET